MSTTPRLLAGLVVLTLFVACSSGGSDDGAGPSSADRPDTEATEKAPDGLGPIEPPAGFARVPGEGFTVYAPSGLTPEQRTSSNGQPMLVLGVSAGGADAADGTDRPIVGVVREVNPTAGALEQSSTLESAKRLVDEATDVRRTVVSWPGARAAVLVEWTVQQRSASTPSTRAVRNLQLLTDIDDGLGLSVVAIAPAELFEQSQVGTVLRTFRPTPVAS